MNWVDIIQCVTTTRLLSSLSLPTFVKITYKALEVCVHSSPSGVDCSHGNNCLMPVSTDDTVGTSMCGLVHSPGLIARFETCTLGIVTRHFLPAWML